MTSPQKIVLLSGSTLMALMLLFPPWDYVDGDTSARHSAGFHFFLTPPQPKPAKEIFGEARYPHLARVSKNNLKLIAQLIITIPILIGLTLLFEPDRHRITTLVGTICLLIPAGLICFIIWLVVSAALEERGQVVH